MPKLFHCIEYPLTHITFYTVEQFGITETPDDGHLWPKHVVKGRSDGNSCIVDAIILCKRYIGATGCLIMISLMTVAKKLSNY
jgi:hypothetical protein